VDRPGGAVKQLDALTGVRGFAAFIVVFFHLQTQVFALLPPSRLLAPLLEQAVTALDLFFVLSGFVLYANYAGVRWNGRSLASFFTNRFARIYPVYFVTFLAIAAAYAAAALLDLPIAGQPGWQVYVANLFLVQSWPLDRIPSLDYVAWSVSAEWFAYLWFPTLTFAFLLVRRRPRWALALAAVLMLANAACTAAAADWFRDWGLSWIVFEFPAGMALAAWYMARQSSAAGDGRARRIAGGLSIALAVAFGIACYAWPTLAHSAGQVWVACVVASLALGQGTMALWLSSRFWLRWGDRSYSLYLGHGVVTLVAAILLQVWEVPLASAAGLAFLLVEVAVIYGFTLALGRFVEWPGRALLRRLAPRVPRPPPSPALAAAPAQGGGPRP